jgi:putative transposase
MANTYTQIHLHIIFAVKYRRALIDPSWKNELHKYTTGIVQNKGHKMMAINSMPDHIHLLIGMRPAENLSTLVKVIKTETCTWIKNRVQIPFAWQEGFGAFSYARADLSRVCTYIQNQEAHHKKCSFLEEYKKVLTGFEVAFDPAYLFTEPV